MDSKEAISTQLSYENEDSDSDESKELEELNSIDNLSTGSESSDFEMTYVKKYESSEDEEAAVNTLQNTWTTVSGKSIKKFTFNDCASTAGIPDMKPNNTKPIDLFNLMVTDEVYELIVFHTNLNANQYLARSTITKMSRLQKWKDTNVSEIKKFLGLVIYMGIVKYPGTQLYWNTSQFYKNNFVPKVMSRNRFEMLLKFIYFADNTTIQGNRLRKVSNLLEILERNFVSAKTPGEILAVDDRMIPKRGRQYSTGKLHTEGVKVYKLCDTYGYTFTSLIYAGQCTDNNQEGRIDQIVLDLAHRYLDNGRTITTNKLCTTISLAELLLHHETYLVGTLRKNRAVNPRDVTNAKLERNEVIGREKSGVVVAKWRHNRDVLMLSTKHTLGVVSTGKRNQFGEEIKKLKMIVEYNKGKQGIDISDQMASYLPTNLPKTIKWYHRIAFEFLLSTSILNALILYKQLQNKNVLILEFRQSICESLCDLEVDGMSSSSNANVKHFIKEFDIRDKANRKVRKSCTGCYKDIKEREGRLVAHGKAKKVTTYCDSCEGKPALCLDCFAKRH